MSIDSQLDILKELINKVNFLEREFERYKTYDSPGAEFPVHYLRVPYTSASWNNTAYSTTGKTSIDLSAVFSDGAGNFVPDFVEAVFVRVAVQDSGAAGTDCFLILSPNNTAGSGIPFACFTANDRFNRTSGLVPCDANGNIYYQTTASGVLTLDVGIQIWGWQYKTK